MTWWLAGGGVLMAGACLWAAGRASGGPGCWRVVAAVLRRRGLAMASYRFRLAVTAVNALLLLALVGFVARGLLLPALGPAVQGAAHDAILYLVVGLAAWPAVWAGYQASANTIRQEQMMGTLEVVATTPVGMEAIPFAALVADGLLALAGAGFLLGIALLLLPLHPLVHPEAAPVGLAAILMAALFLWGIGLIGGALTAYYKELGGADSVLRFVLIVLSGVYFPLSALPDWAAAAGGFIPLTIAFELLRASFTGGLDATQGLLRLGVLAGAALVSVAAGTRAFAGGVGRARRAGVLQGY